MNEKNKPRNGNGWWKGTFPIWLVVILLGLLGFFMRREITENDNRHIQRQKENNDMKLEFIELRVRMALMEQELRDQKVILERIENQIKPLWRP